MESLGHCCVDRSKSAGDLDVPDVRSDCGAEFVEGCREPEMSVARFNAKLVVAALHVLDERMAPNQRSTRSDPCADLASVGVCRECATSREIGNVVWMARRSADSDGCGRGAGPALDQSATCDHRRRPHPGSAKTVLRYICYRRVPGWAPEFTQPWHHLITGVHNHGII